MNRLGLMHDLALSVYKLFFFVPRKVRFLAMTMSEQARLCSFNLMKTLVNMPKVIGKLSVKKFPDCMLCALMALIMEVL